MPVRNLEDQAFGYRTGKIHLGRKVPTGRTGEGGRPETRPAALDTLRFTSPARPAVEAIAGMYGGPVCPWDNNGRREWEVVTRVDEIPVVIPPEPGAIDTWLEMWYGGRCLRRCDGKVEQKSGEPCMCPQPADPSDRVLAGAAALERRRLAALKPPRGCLLKTRVSLILPDAPDIGRWLLESGGFYAAGEMLSKASVMKIARAQQAMLPARLWIDRRTEVGADGYTRRYVVPVLSFLDSFRAIYSGTAGGGLGAQLPPPRPPSPPGSRQAAGRTRRGLPGPPPAPP